MGNQYKGTVGATRRCWPNQILRANCSLNMIPKVDMCTYPVISMFIQILVKCQLSSFVPDASLACTEWRCQKSRSWVHCFRPCHPAPGLAVKKWPSLSENPEAGCYLWELTGLDRFAGNEQNGCLPLRNQDPSSHHCFWNSQMPESSTLFLLSKWNGVVCQLPSHLCQHANDGLWGFSGC